jgi:hypothetical protein
MFTRANREVRGKLASSSGHPFELCVKVTGKEMAMIRKLKSGGDRLYSRKKNPKTGKRRNLGTFKTRGAAEKHEGAVQFFKRH